MKCKHKLSAALLTTCTMLIFSGAALAAPPPCDAAPPVYTECFERGSIAGPAPIDRRAAMQYRKDFKGSCSWMYADTRRDAAYSFARIDNAQSSNKISQQQADKLKKKLISFYKNRQNYQDDMRKLDRREARHYHRQHREHFSLHDNIPKLAEETGIAKSTLADILRPQRRHHRFMMQRPDSAIYNIKQQLIGEGKVSQQELDAIKNYMDSMHDKYVQMDADQKDTFIRDFKQQSDDEKLNSMAEGTGISADRLKQIFSAFKDEVQQDI